jgi:hypothetical protein
MFVGLCQNCTFLRKVENSKGSKFFLCRRSVEDKSFPKYPALPVVSCPGFKKLPPVGNQ